MTKPKKVKETGKCLDGLTHSVYQLEFATMPLWRCLEDMTRSRNAEKGLSFKTNLTKLEALKAIVRIADENSD